MSFQKPASVLAQPAQLTTRSRAHPHFIQHVARWSITAAQCCRAYNLKAVDQKHQQLPRPENGKLQHQHSQQVTHMSMKACHILCTQLFLVEPAWVACKALATMGT